MEAIRFDLSEGNTGAANAKLSALNWNIYLDDSLEIEMFKQLMDVYVELIDSSETIYDLDESQEDAVRDIAASRTSIAVHAEIILAEVFGDTFYHPIMKITTGPGKREPDSGAKYPTFHMYPNPTTGTVTLLYDLPEEGVLSVYDLQGRRMTQVILPEGEHTTVLDLATVRSGFYVYVLKGESMLIQSGKIVVLR